MATAAGPRRAAASTRQARARASVTQGRTECWFAAEKIAINPIHVAHALATGKTMGKRGSGASAWRTIRKGTAAKPAKNKPRKQPVTRKREGSSTLRVQP